MHRNENGRYKRLEVLLQNMAIFQCCFLDSAKRAAAPEDSAICQTWFEQRGVSYARIPTGQPAENLTAGQYHRAPWPG